MASQIIPGPDETLILLARHGKTDYNEKGERIQGGNSDRPGNQLNQNGKDEARRLGRMMAQMFPKMTPFSGGETCFELLERFNQGITGIAKENIGQTVCVASHGAAITTFTIEYQTHPEEAPLKHYRDVGVRQMRNCEVAVFSFNHNAEGKDQI